MRRCVLIVMLMVCVLGLTSCGNISDKVTQKLNTIEVGEDFDINSFFEVEEGIAISLKDTDIDMSAIGPHSIDLIISDGKKEEEKTFTVNVVDTQAPVIKTRDITLYEGLKFHAEEFATVSDNSGEDISATVKNSNVDTSTAGEYYVTYEAIDSSGNSTEKTATVEVRLLNSSKDVMDVVDQYLTEERLSGYEKKDIALDGQDLLESVCVTSPRLSNTVIEKCREVTMCPEIWCQWNFAKI